MKEPVLTKKVSEKRRAWLRSLKVGDKVAMWDGISWSEAVVKQDHVGQMIHVKAVNYYGSCWFRRTAGYDSIGDRIKAYIGPMDDYQHEVEVDEAKRLLNDFPYGFDGISDDIVVEAAKILRDGKRAI